MATRTGADPGVSAARSAPPAFHLLAKPTGAVCNLDCAYCFFLSKEMLYPGSRFRMADELLEAYVAQLIEAHAGAPEVTIAWRGGEPTLMGLDFFRRSVEIANRYLKPGQRVVCTIQTNGTLLDEIHHVDRPMRFMVDRLRRGEAPADVVRLYASEDASRGRNDLCTCASGRKWKRCHGA